MARFRDAFTGEIRELNVGASRADRLAKQATERERAKLLDAMWHWQQPAATPQGGAPHRQPSTNTVTMGEA